MSGYWILIATVRPSSRRPRYTCPIEAEAIAPVSISAIRDRRLPSSPSRAACIVASGTLGALSNSGASRAVNSSRADAEVIPTSTTDSS
ncbi:Uncharacterised protein [Mycobacteroides abscessus subsp. abscessus]|nr:Uncharacterised protein [Mycobacteroides abscessus subsp. abscessus]